MAMTQTNYESIASEASKAAVDGAATEWWNPDDGQEPLLAVDCATIR